MTLVHQFTNLLYSIKKFIYVLHICIVFCQNVVNLDGCFDCFFSD
jgi:hypothetical protein